MAHVMGAFRWEVTDPVVFCGGGFCGPGNSEYIQEVESSISQGYSLPSRGYERNYEISGIVRFLTHPQLRIPGAGHFPLIKDQGRSILYTDVMEYNRKNYNFGTPSELIRAVAHLDRCFI